ncbi:hypothetical protein GCM10025876_37820 [Demequina litorisediminis]|uniref:ABC1 atypical kinase-like domain-containing protein n=1 Tax=Demequina litorisediminis TaxID=1849022 RepID=A0ABQ6ILM1_9MICO|nr:hypothetical protein GCM10025876_37820 [Demequina litorisediminis]
MSSRLDVLPPEITKELEGLQDEVPAVPFEALRAQAEAELGVPLAAAFATLDPVPIAAASLGQVHRARLREDDAAACGFADVVVKVQRPGIGAIVDVDLAALRRVARWLMKVRGVRARVDMPALIEEFAHVSREEVDYLHEASASERFADVFADDARVHVPRVVWERTSRRVLVLEDVSAIKITDHAALRDAEIAPAAVARVFAEVMLDQALCPRLLSRRPASRQPLRDARCLRGAGLASHHRRLRDDGRGPRKPPHRPACAGDRRGLP